MADTLDPQRALQLTAALQGILEKGDVGERAAKADRPLMPGEVLDLVWQIVFGKSREDSTHERGAVFVLALYGNQPLLGWHLNKLPVSEIVTLLATTVALVGQRDGWGIIDEMMQALTVLKDRQAVDDADGSTKH